MSTSLRPLAESVASELGEGWSVDTSDDFADHRSTCLNGAGGARLALSPDWRNAERVEISGIYPRHEKYGVERHEIGVSSSRGPVIIAREIRRRLLPDYLTDLMAIHADNADRVQMRAARLELAQTIAGIVNGTIDSEDDRSTSTRVRWHTAVGSGYGHVRISYRADSISELEIHSADVGRILAALKALQS